MSLYKRGNVWWSCVYVDGIRHAKSTGTGPGDSDARGFGKSVLMQHLASRLNLVVVAKSDPARIRNFARERGWRQLRLLSSRNNNYNRDYHAEWPEGEQSPILNVFTRNGDEFRRRWAAELMFAPREEGEEPRHVNSFWPIWNVLDLTPGGRGDDPDFPALHYG